MITSFKGVFSVDVTRSHLLLCEVVVDSVRYSVLTIRSADLSWSLVNHFETTTLNEKVGKYKSLNSLIIMKF